MNSHARPDVRRIEADSIVITSVDVLFRLVWLYAEGFRE